MEMTRYLLTYPAPDRPGRVVLCATRYGALLEISEGMLARIRNLELSEKEQATLVNMGILVPDSVAEQAEARATFERSNAASRCFTAMVTLTLECNLACPYCYEDPFRGRHVMGDETADQVVATAAARMAAGQAVILDFYGGEALLALPLIRRIAAPLRDEAARQGVAFSFNLVTNGTLLTRRTVEELVALGLQGAKLTLDGPREIHDQQRPFVSGKGSFDLIIANIKGCWDLLALQLGGNYTRHNYRRFPELLDHLLAEGVTPEMLKMVMFGPVTPKADGSVAGDFSATCACTDEPWMIEASIYLRGEVQKRGFSAPKIKPTGCMVEFENDLVVAWDGSLYKCPAFMGDETLKIGTLAGGVNDYRESHKLDLWKCDDCLDCVYLPLCFGGCRFLRRLRTGAIDGLDCRKGYYDAALERIIMQDLRLVKRG